MFLKKCLIVLILSFSVVGCNIASKSGLEETKKDLAELAKFVERLAESHEYFVYIVMEYSDFIPKETADVVKQDAKNRVTEAKTIETKITENSKKDCGFFSKAGLSGMIIQFWDVAKPIIVKTGKAIVDAGSSQGGAVGLICGTLMTIYGVYQQISKNSVVAKVKEEKAEAKEIEHEADKLVPADHHEVWEKAEKEATVKVMSRKKRIT